MPRRSSACKRRESMGQGTFANEARFSLPGHEHNRCVSVIILVVQRGEWTCGDCARGMVDTSGFDRRTVRRLLVRLCVCVRGVALRWAFLVDTRGLEHL